MYKNIISFDFAQRVGAAYPVRQQPGELPKKHVPTNSKIFKALCVGICFAVAFVAGLILFAAVVGYHLN
jgi:hypothetical protein